MNTKYFQHFSIYELCHFIKNTKTQLYLSLPSLHSEIVEAVIELTKYVDTSNIHILIDFDAETLRQGYGEFNAVEQCIKLLGNKQVQHLKDNRISFVIIDDIGYYLFLESKHLIPSEKSLLNAVAINSVEIVKLKQHFFKYSATPAEFKNELSNAVITEGLNLDKAEQLFEQNEANTSTIDAKTVQEVKEDITKNPSKKPDFQRIVNTYSNKFQYVELVFKGKNFKSKKVSIPSEALPYGDEELKQKLETKLRIFDEKEIEQYFKPNKNRNQATFNFTKQPESSYDGVNNFQKTEGKVQALRDEFLTTIHSAKGKNLLKMEKKKLFVKKLDDLKSELSADKNIDLYNFIFDSIEKAKVKVEETLTKFLIDNPTPEIEKYGDRKRNKMVEQAMIKQLWTGSP